tara:strand:+ start:990 stop:1115 length:126 start_codon:yes stop_codon:yes gene_type:complete
MMNLLFFQENSQEKKPFFRLLPRAALAFAILAAIFLPALVR